MKPKNERRLKYWLLLFCLKQLLPKRPDLKVIITSATIDPGFSLSILIKLLYWGIWPNLSGRSALSSYCGDALDDKDMTEGIIDAIDELSRESAGDILIFMSGEREIRIPQRH